MGAVNDIYLLQVRGSLDGQDIIHTLHFKSATVGADAAQQQDLIDSWQASSQTAWLGVNVTQYTLVDITAQRVCGTLPLPAASLEAVNTPGTAGTPGATQRLPAWMSALCRERTGFAGKSYAGRFFIPVPGDTYIDGTLLTAAFGALIQAYLTSLASYLAGGADADWDLFVYSRKLASVPGVQCQNTGAVVTNLSYSPYVTTTRSRRSRTGA